MPFWLWGTWGEKRLVLDSWCPSVTCCLIFQEALGLVTCLIAFVCWSVGWAVDQGAIGKSWLFFEFYFCYPGYGIRCCSCLTNDLDALKLQLMMLWALCPLLWIPRELFGASFTECCCFSLDKISRGPCACRKNRFYLLISVPSYNEQKDNCCRL